MARRRRRCYSGIGGQAVLEGVMMKNQEKYAVAVRRPNGEIVLELENYQGLLHGNVLNRIPFVRGIFNFIDSMVLGMKCLNYSALVEDVEEGQEEGTPSADSGKGGEKLKSALVTIASIVLAVGLFVVLPYYVASLIGSRLHNTSLLAIIEGLIRIVVFILYVWGISAMKDIKRLYQYHGAEHKCINCIERGRPLTVQEAEA